MNILDYIKGNRKGKNARKIELEAMQDPFLADAIEGFDSVKGDHADKITQLQAKISGRSSSSGNKKYLGFRIAAAAIVMIALISGYFTLMNHQSSMLAAKESEGMYINIYAPEEYVDRKRAELSENQTNANSALRAVVDIQNLNEVIKPFEPMNVYIPESYAEMKKGNLKIEEELFSTPNKQTEKLYAVAENMGDDKPTNDLLSFKQKKESSSNNASNWSISAGASQALSEVQEPPTPALSPAESFADRYIVNSQKNKTIKGRVLDQTGEPLIGATITEKGSTNGVITDIDGNFSLNVKTDSPEIVAKYIGFEPVTIANPLNQQDIVLKEDRLALDEVVVVGYGAQKKSNLTGAISSVKANDENFYKKSGELEKALQGKVAGVSISKAAKDDTSKIRIRGMSSIPSTESEKIVSKPLIGDKQYKEYLKKNLVKPTTTDCKDKKGTVTLELSVDDQGNPINIKVIKGICNAYDNEAIRLVKNGSKWTIGNQRVKVEVEF